MDLKNIHRSKIIRGIIIGLGIAVIALVIFKLGQWNGYHKARFADRLGDNFNRNFRDPRGGFLRLLGGPGMPGGHGAAGEIVSVNLPLLVVAGPDNLEKIIVVTENTLIREFQNEIEASNLAAGERIVVLGRSNSDGQIEAKLIRVMPELPRN